VSKQREDGFSRWFRWTLVAGCLTAAILLRLWHLTTVPPGLHLDEAMDIHLGLQVLRGDHFIYSPEGWGREGMYYYLEAPLLHITRDGILGVRLTSALLGIALVALAGLLAHRMFGPDTGVLTLAWTALTFWPVFASRVGVRNILLGPVLGLAMLAFWQAWHTPPTPRWRHLAWFGLAGLLAGLCLYTHQSSRVVPLIYVAFLTHAALSHRRRLRDNRWGLLLGGLLLVLVSLPLALFLYLHPTAEGPERVAALEPLRALVEGDPRPMATNLLAVLGMFTVRGDPLYTYNVPGRPVFPGLAALPFYLGALLCLRRWREPACALLCIWLGVMLIPTLVTVSAPLFLRSTGALIPAMSIPALGLGAAVRFLSRRWGRPGRWAGYLLVLLLLAQTGWLTWRDYFDRWALLEQVGINYNVRETALVRYLRDGPGGEPTVVGARYAEDTAPFILSTAFLEDPPPVRWVLPTAALAFPTGQPAARFILLTDTQTDGYLARHFLQGEGFSPEAGRGAQGEPWLVVFRLRPPEGDPPLPETEPPWSGPWFGPPDSELPDAPEEELVAARLPAEFQHRLSLLEYGLSSHSLQPGERLRLVTLWRILADGWPGNLAMFAHLVDAHGQIVAQQDQFGYPVHSWRTGDLVVQVHDLTLDPATPPGTYWLQIGFYERHLPGRWTVTDALGGTTSDRLLLDQVEVQP